MPNPQIPLGTLNLAKASITVPSFTALNVTASFLGKGGINITRNGDTTGYLEQMAGAVTSPNPYQMCTVNVVMVKSQSLAGAYEAKRKSDARVGNITIRPDVTTGIGPIDLNNCSILNVGALTFNGTDAGYPIILTGYENINSDMWD